MNNQEVTASHLMFLMDQHESPHQSVSSTSLVDASLAPLKRRFERLNDALHEKLPFSTPKTTHSLTTVFEGSRYDTRDQQKVVVESEPHEEESCTETSDKLYVTLGDVRDQYGEDQEDGLIDYDGEEEEDEESTAESVAPYLVVCGVMGQNDGLRKLRGTQRARFVSIPDVVEEICDWCFSWCKSLSRVTFVESSSLKLIGKEAFSWSGLREIHIPDGVELVLMDSDTSLPSQCRVMKLT